MPERVGEDSPAIAVTGATGLVGHMVLANLLERGQRCVALVRAPLDDSAFRLRRLLAEAGCDANEHLASGLLTLHTCDLTSVIAPVQEGSIASVIHCAASTRFEESATGELMRTNVGGVERLLAWCTSHGVRRVFYVSTAYVCDTGHDAPEAIGWSGPPRNDYEATKRLAEERVASWAAQDRARSATILRPSIVVGEADTGRCTRFGGFYLAVRATQALGPQLGEENRNRAPLRLFGHADDSLDLVPVDWVASMIAGIAMEESLHGQVYHLTHPEPPTNGEAQGAIERVLGIRGGRFAPIDASDAPSLNAIEQLFHSVQAPIRGYLLNPPRFDRENAVVAEKALNISCPCWTPERLDRLVAYPVETKWRRTAGATGSDDKVAEYFEIYLPSRLARQALPGGEMLNASVRFVITDVPNGEWVCRFLDGRLTHVRRGARRESESIRYETTKDAFWSIVTGTETPQDVFLRGDAEVGGNVEQALMLGALLRLFNEVHPYGADLPALAEGAA